MARFFILICISSMCCGCTHLQLKKSASKQTRTVTDIYHSQVLDNLAMFCVNENSMPHFSVVASGVTQISDQAGGTVGLAWNPTTLIGETLGINGSRGIAENWSLAPVTSPARLKKMQVIYQYVVSGTVPSVWDKKSNQYVVDPDYKEYIDRLNATCWFENGKKPLRSKCCEHSGEYCGTHIWVPYESNQYLTELTLVILDIASAAGPTMEVTDYEYENGRIKRQTKQVVPADEDSSGRASITSEGTDSGTFNKRRELYQNFYVPQGGQGLQFVPSGR